MSHRGGILCFAGGAKCLRQQGCLNAGARSMRDLKHLRDGIQLALAHAQASKDKEKFVLPLKESRRAVIWCLR